MNFSIASGVSTSIPSGFTGLGTFCAGPCSSAGLYFPFVESAEDFSELEAVADWSGCAEEFWDEEGLELAEVELEDAVAFASDGSLFEPHPTKRRDASSAVLVVVRNLEVGSERDIEMPFK